MLVVLEYVNLTKRQIDELDRERTLFLMSVSPIEIHGPHLPVGTDVFIAEELLKRYSAAIADRHPELRLIKLPPLFLGSDALPVKGSLSITPRALERVLVDFARGLSDCGFRYLLLADNHGGPRHQMACEAAARKAYRKFGFYLINPFLSVFRYMVQHEPEFMTATGLPPGRCGDDADSHAGTNETSLMLATYPEKVDRDYASLTASRLRPSTAGKAVRAAAGLIKALGAKVLANDLEHLANTLDWIGDPDMKPYMGDPSQAGAVAGEAMLNARVAVAMELLEKALRGEPVRQRPLLWGLRLIR